MALKSALIAGIFLSSPLILPRNACASDPLKYDVKIVLADKTEQELRILESLMRAIPSATRMGEPSKFARRRPTIYLAVGPVALKNAMSMAEQDSVVVSLYNSSVSYRSVTENKKASPSVTAIFADPSPAHQLRLISLIHKRSARIALLYSDKSEHLVGWIRKSAKEMGNQVFPEKIAGTTEDLNQKLRDINGYPVLLAIPDASIFNAENIRNILLSAYRGDQYVIGFSQSMVKAGALATVKSELSDIAEHARELVSEIDVGGAVPEPDYPRYFSVSVNEAVANSLNVVIDDKVRNYASRPRRGI